MDPLIYLTLENSKNFNVKQPKEELFDAINLAALSVRTGLGSAGSTWCLTGEI
jgi:hypothetical protein